MCLEDGVSSAAPAAHC